MAEFFPSNNPESLVGILQSSQDNAIGSPEKNDISKILKESTCFLLRKDEAIVSGWIANNPISIISDIGNILNSINNYKTPIWIEGNFDLFSTYADELLTDKIIDKLSGHSIGFLFFKEDNGIIGCVTFWSRPKVDENDVVNITICPVVHHINVEMFELLDNDMKPRLIDGFLGRRYNLKNFNNLIKKDNNLYNSLSMGIKATFLNGIVDDASIINNHNEDSEWKESYIKISGFFASRLIFLGISGLTTMLIDSKKILPPGYIYYKNKSLKWCQNNNILSIPIKKLDPITTGQKTINY